MRTFPLLLLAVSQLFGSSLFSQSVFINEFLASNSSVIADEAGEYDDWVELYNAGDTPVDIGGWYITDDLDVPAKWQIPLADPAATTITAGGFLLLWFDKDPGQGILHVDTKLSADGEDIGLFGPDGAALIDTLSFGPQTADVSMGRMPDGGADLEFFTFPTPGESNSGSTGGLFAQAPEVSVNGGFFTNAFPLELSSPTPAAEIHYTLDGSAPDENSPLYTVPLDIDHTTTLRAMALVPGFFPSPVTTHSYLFEEAHTFPVIALSFDHDDFFDPATGIYPNYTQDWERPVHVEFYENDGQLAFSQAAIVEIHGTGSAQLPQKSLKIKAKADNGSGFFEHDLFKDLPFDKYKSFLLRNSGQDWNTTMFRDAFVASLAGDLSDVGDIIEAPKLNFQAFRPGVVYLNGIYWGIHNIREHLNENYVEQHTGLTENDIDFLDNGEVKNGTADQWNDLKAFMLNNPFSDDASLAELGQHLDLQHFLDYNAFNIIIDNSDWPGNNYRRWRARSGEEPWQFLTFDLDFSFGLFNILPGGITWNTGEASANSLARALDATNSTWPNPWWNTLFFRKPMENASFRRDFINRTADLLNVLFDPARVNNRLDEFTALYEPEYGRHFDKWASGWNPSSANIELLRDFANERPDYLREQVVTAFAEVNGTVHLMIQVVPAEGGHIELSTLNLTAERLPWNGEYFSGVDIPVTAIPAPGFTFTGWSDASMVNAASSSVNLSGDDVLVAYFTYDSTALQLQSIDFPPIPNQLIDTAPFSIAATASSGLPVVFTIIDGPATVGGNVITLDGVPGIVIVQASQPGDSQWQAAPVLNRSFKVLANEPPGPPGAYCDVKAEQPWHEWIERVEFGNIDHVSYKTQYGNFTDIVTGAGHGEVITLKVTPSYSWTIFEEYFRVWIDFNRDGDFEDVGELVLEDHGTQAVSADVLIPFYAAFGETRMRVAMKRGEYAEPCESFNRGEVEDYTVVLGVDGLLLPEGRPVDKADLIISPNPVGDVLTTRFTTLDEGVVLFKVIQSNGMTVYAETLLLPKGEQLVQHDVSKLNSGQFNVFIQLPGQHTLNGQFIKMTR